MKPETKRRMLEMPSRSGSISGERKVELLLKMGNLSVVHIASSDIDRKGKISEIVQFDIKSQRLQCARQPFPSSHRASLEQWKRSQTDRREFVRD